MFDVEAIKQTIIEKDGVFLKQEIINKVRYFFIKCNKDNNIWKVSLTNFKKGQWCKKCHNANKIKSLNHAEAIVLFKEKNFDLLTPLTSYWAKIKLKCNIHNHEWETSYGYLIRGGNCKYCGHDTVSFNSINKIITNKNATFIERIHGSSTTLNIRLKCNIHNKTWKTNARDILNEKRWCGKCKLEERKIPFKTIKYEIEIRDGILLTKDCSGSITKIDVECSEGHIFNTCYDYIKSGNWCPQCITPTQSILFEIIKELYPNCDYKYNYRGFSWLKDKYRLEIDIFVYNENFTLGVEYDGRQHFQPVVFGNYGAKDAKVNLKNTQKRDKLKDRLIANHPEDIKYFIRFNYKDKITKESVIQKLKLNSIPI